MRNTNEFLEYSGLKHVAGGPRTRKDTEHAQVIAVGLRILMHVSTTAMIAILDRYWLSISMTGMCHDADLISRPKLTTFYLSIKELPDSKHYLSLKWM